MEVTFYQTLGSCFREIRNIKKIYFIDFNVPELEATGGNCQVLFTNRYLEWRKNLVLTIDGKVFKDMTKIIEILKGVYNSGIGFSSTKYCGGLDFKGEFLSTLKTQIPGPYDLTIYLNSKSPIPIGTLFFNLENPDIIVSTENFPVEWNLIRSKYIYMGSDLESLFDKGLVGVSGNKFFEIIPQDEELTDKKIEFLKKSLDGAKTEYLVDRG